MRTVDEKLRALRPIIGNTKSQKLRQMYLFEDDFREKKQIENLIDQLVAKHVTPTIDERIILPPPGLEACRGDIHLGQVEYLDRNLYPIGIDTKDLTRHAGIFGSTGSGKTTFALNLIRQLHAKGIPFLVIDWEASYRSLAKEIDNLTVFTIGSDINPFYLNPFHLPPGISKEEYSKSLIAILAEDYLSGAGSDVVLLKYMKTAYFEHANPTFNNMKEIVLRDSKKAMRGRTMLWKETVGRIIANLSIGTAGQILGSGKHHPLDKLFEKNIVLELGGIQSPRDRKFIIHVILNWLFLWMQHRGLESETLKQTIIFEEFHNIVMKNQSDNFVGSMFRQARKYGVGLVAIDQTPSEVTNEIYGNMNTKVSFSLSTNQDIQAMSKAMNLGYNSSYLGMLETGQAITAVKQKYPDPFLLKVPFTHKDEYVSDAELKEAMQPFSAEISSIYKESSHYLEPRSSQDTYIPPLSQKLDPLEKVLITNITEKPLQGIDERTKLLGIHPTQMVLLQVSLAKKGLIKTVYVERKKLIELTDAGREAAIEADIKLSKRQTRGGIEHYYWIQKTRQFLRNLGFQPVLEAGGIDISDMDYSLAIEIETGKSNLQKNLQKLINSPALHLFILATNKPAEFKIRKLTAQYARIRTMHAKDFLRLSKEEILRR